MPVVSSCWYFRLLHIPYRVSQFLGQTQHSVLSHVVKGTVIRHIDGTGLSRTLCSCLTSIQSDTSVDVVCFNIYFGE